MIKHCQSFLYVIGLSIALDSCILWVKGANMPVTFFIRFSSIWYFGDLVACSGRGRYFRICLVDIVDSALTQLFSLQFIKG